LKLNSCRWFIGFISLLVISLGMGAGLYLLGINTSNAFGPGGTFYCIGASIFFIALVVMGTYVRNEFFRRW
jgi:hypothetical protein